jgi:phosphoglycolate phosphatase-like HAD superfamily hydrolase
MEARLILFDIDGTLIDTAGAGRRAVERAFCEVFDVENGSEVVDGVPFAGLTDWRIFESLGRAAGAAPSTFERLWPDLQRAYVRALGAEMERPDPRRRVLPGVRRLLEDLTRRDGVHIGLLTGNLERGARIKLAPFGLNRFFRSGGFGSDHRDRREVARVACRKLSALTGIPFSGSSVVVVGDTAHDVDCARANDFRAVAVHTGWSSREALESAGPFRLLDDLADRPRVLEAFGLEDPRLD